MQVASYSYFYIANTVKSSKFNVLNRGICCYMNAPVDTAGQCSCCGNERLPSTEID